jgi:hypothetical protein
MPLNASGCQCDCHHVNTAYEGLENDIVRTKTKGYIQMLTRSHRFVVPVQARLFEV